MSHIVYIAAPAYTVSGGPELLHQLCAELRDRNIDAYMLYIGVNDTDECPQADRYKKYNLPWVYDLIDNENNFLIWPEAGVDIIYQAKRIKKILWWLSVDNMYLSIFSDIDNSFRLINTQEMRVKKVQEILISYHDILQSAVCHLVQSEYAYNHCIELGISKERIKYLGDYLRDDFIENALQDDNADKHNIVVYNPVKGIEFTNKLIELAPEIDWFPLQRLSPSEMSFVLRHVKVYIDFGNHPGMDRIPREAAISGCCVITGKKGSAAFYNDVPIPSEYKFDDNDSDVYIKVLDKIKEIFNDYDRHSNKFNAYREMILCQQDKFKEDVKKIFIDELKLV